FTLSGGGTVTWGGPGADGGLKWTKRFIAISMESGVTYMGSRVISRESGATFSAGHIDIIQPTENIPGNNVFDGKPRSVDKDGVILYSWEALYAVHTIGDAQDAVSYRIVKFTKAFEAPSNWVLVAVVNGDNNSIKLGTGLILNKNTSSTNGSPIPVGVIMMWSGQVANIPDGWALCNGENSTPDLRNRFIIGSGGIYSPGVTGGEDSVALKLNEIPSHNHANGKFKYLLQYTGQDTHKGNTDNTVGQPDVSNKGEIQSVGGNWKRNGKADAHENKPPYYALCFIMKL
ncbi:MAG: hypothetical protein F6K24_10350, partial [Okeania sp. SIO2D1]|nr:hypothetical protein [Okeania sp. SIO2D1]